MRKTLFRLSTCAAALLLLATLAFAGDPDRDRKARAALVLADCGGKADCERRARVAFALAESDAKTAPVPKAKSCTCDKCECCDKKCPACPAVRADVKDSLVRVRRNINAQQDANGSGTVIWTDGKRSVILTAAHVLDAGGGAITVRGGGKWLAAEVLGRDAANDLAALVVGAELPAVAVSDNDPTEGVEVTMLGVTSLWSKGKILAADSGRYLLGYDSDNGDSGGGVFVGGELVGVHCGKYSATQTPYCTGAKAVRGFLGHCFKKNAGKVEPVAVVQVPAPVVPAAPVIVPAGYSTCPGGTCQPAPRGYYRRW